MKSYSTRLSSKIIIKPSPIHGKGMFASRDIQGGETLIVWRDGYTDRRGAEKARTEGKGTMQWDDDVFSVELDGDQDPYSINHSCDPNAWMADAYTVIARRDIAPGEEITIDCAMFEADEDYISAFECNCGSPICRGRITGKDWRRKELQVQYWGHFSPLINERIARLKSDSHE